MSQSTRVAQAIDDLMKPEELAGEWKVSPKTLANQRSRGEGPPYVRLSTGAIRYSRRACAQYLEQRTVTPAAVPRD